MSVFWLPLRVAFTGAPDYPDLGDVARYVRRLHAGCTVVVADRGPIALEAVRAAQLRGLAVDDRASAGASVALGRAAAHRLVRAAEALVVFCGPQHAAHPGALAWASRLGRTSEVVVASAGFWSAR